MREPVFRHVYPVSYTHLDVYKRQIQNKEKAFALLRTKLYDMELQKKQDAEAEERLVLSTRGPGWTYRW